MANKTTEQLIQEKGLTAPRVTPQDVITRLIHGAKLLTPEQKQKIFS